MSSPSESKSNESSAGPADNSKKPSTSSPSKRPTSENASSKAPMKKKAEDFIFGKMIGEGSYSTVLLAKEVATGNEYAIKVLEKKHVLKEKKSEYVRRERDVFSKINHPFFVHLYFTFQDTDRLYFGLSYARGGELLDHINKLGCFDYLCTQFYSAEIVLALEYLHGLKIIHRDLKPENILLSDKMHIQITDFGSAKMLDSPETNTDKEGKDKRRNSFVGTAQYVSPEVLTSKSITPSSDLWALGCIIYQLSSGQLPFWGGHEYQIFQKITKLEYEFPEGFDPTIKDLVSKLLVLDPDGRLGSESTGGFDALKAHPFFKGVDWATLHQKEPPQLMPFLPGKDAQENLYSSYDPGLNDQHLSRLIGIDIGGANEQIVELNVRKTRLGEQEKKERLELQSKDNSYHRFVENHIILKQGLLDKRKGLFARRRMFLLTEGPCLYYVDPQNMVLKGQVPWSKELRPEAKNFKIFFIHTPKRTYYLEDPEGNALKWCKRIEEVWTYYYGDQAKT